MVKCKRMAHNWSNNNMPIETQIERFLDTKALSKNQIVSIHFNSAFESNFQEVYIFYDDEV